MKIKSIENFKNNEILLNTDYILGGVKTGAGTRSWSGCASGMCYSSDDVNGDGTATYYNIHDCDVES